MLRDKLIDDHIHKHTHKPHEFRWRSREISRLEGLSDAVFGFAITLLIVALEVPKTSGELLETMRGFASFAITFTLLYLLWYRQFTFFRRYGLEDAPTVALNGALLFLVLFFVFPLKFFLGTMVDRLMGAPRTIRLPNGAVERVIQPGHMSLLMSIYGLGFTAVSLIFFLLYVHAWRKREELHLNELEVFDTRRTLEANAHTVVIGALTVATAWVTGIFHGTPDEDRAAFAILGVFYAYLALMLYRTRLLGRRRKAMVARIKELAAEGDVGPSLQS
jgi:type IV secretory pathway TrbD component